MATTGQRRLSLQVGRLCTGPRNLGLAVSMDCHGSETGSPEFDSTSLSSIRLLALVMDATIAGSGDLVCRGGWIPNAKSHRFPKEWEFGRDGEVHDTQETSGSIEMLHLALSKL